MEEEAPKNRNTITCTLAIVVLILLAALLYMWNSTSNEIAGMAKANSSLDDKVVRLEKDIAGAKASVDELKSEGRELRGAAAKLNAENEELKKRVTSLDISLAEADETIGRLNELMSVRRKAIENMRNKIAELKEENKKLREAMERTGLFSIPDETSSAIPSVPDAKASVVLEMRDVDGMSSVLSGAWKMMTRLSDDLPGNKQDISYALEFLKAAGEFTGSVKEMSALVAASDESKADVYISFFVDGGAFDDFISKATGPVYRFDEWDTALAPGGAWIVKVDSLERPVLYVLKLSDGLKTMVLMSDNENALLSMMKASSGIIPRCAVKRATSGRNFYQLKFDNGVLAGDLARVFGEAMPPSLGEARDKILWTISECSWTKVGDAVEFDSYSDLFERNPELLPARAASAAQYDIYGGGDLAFFMSADLRFLLNVAFIGYNDPIKEFISRFAGDLSPFLPESEIANIIDSGKLSAAITSGGENKMSAYLMIEADSPKAVDSLFSLTSLLDGMDREEIAGWDDAAIKRVPSPSAEFGAELNVVLARRGGTILAGIGGAGDFAAAMPLSDDVKSYMSKDNIMGVVVSSKIFDEAMNLFRIPLAEGETDDARGARELYDILGELRDSFDMVCSRLDASRRGAGKIVFKETSPIN
ncbi:MAG: hypothetical protein LBT23_04930 [Synergistaceae bacterium]|jgi:uncharacterized coiled-coil protein SlyX|nr:hypothetical protein [Synergistaceae bacterium]